MLPESGQSLERKNHLYWQKLPKILDFFQNGGGVKN